jgi:hypothetical protein
MSAAELVVIVPAWKPDFLRAALQSIANQTDKRFRCQIFDDAAVPEVASICAEFPQFDYLRFDSNLGGQSLVAHWNRCLARVPEPWVWLFSDDDVMSPGCVAAFQAARASLPAPRLFQFAVDMVSADLQTVLWAALPPALESASAFLRARLGHRRLSCVPEHVFHAPTLRHLHGGFVDFPMAWGSDDATWALLGRVAGIAGVPQAKVMWRQSALNISNGGYRRWEKLACDLEFLDWLQHHVLLDAAARRLTWRWLGTRMKRQYAMDWRDLPRLAGSMPPRRWPALAWAVLIAGRDRFRS